MNLSSNLSSFLNKKEGTTFALSIGDDTLTRHRLDKGNSMSFSPTDPVSAHSLWLQLRSTRRRHRRPQWRGDTKAVVVSLLLLSILALFYMIMLHNQATENPNYAVQKAPVLHDSPMFGSLARPEDRFDHTLNHIAN